MGTTGTGRDVRNEKDLQRVFEARRPIVLGWIVGRFSDIGVGCEVLGGHASRVLELVCDLWRARTPTLREDAVQNPVNPYGYTKLVVERMLKDAEAAYGIDTWRCATSTRLAPTPTANLASCTSREQLIPLVLRGDGAAALGQDLRTFPCPTAPAFETTCM
jgi:hypothetical protein